MAQYKSKKKKKDVSSKSIYLIISCIILILFLLVIIQKANISFPPIFNTQAASQGAWLMFDGDAQKSGNNTNETILTRSTVTQLKQIWQISLPAVADGSPTYLSDVTTPQGVKSLIFVTTTAGSLVAIDDATGATVWQENTNGNSGPITSSPAIDPNFQYVYSYGKDGKVHKYAVGNGAEVTSGGWPFLVTYEPNVEKGSSALTIGNGYVYMGTSAYPGDNGSYVGHLVGKNLTTGAIVVFNTLCAQTKQVMNGTCTSRESGIWGRPGAVVDPVTGNVFITSGNGSYAPPNNLGDSIIELTPDLGRVIDTYTPTKFQTLDNDDEDLGSTEPAMIPAQTQGNPTYLAVQGSKDDTLRVVNRQNLSGRGAPYNTGGELQSLAVNCNIFSQPIGWNDASGNTWVFATDMCDNLYAYKVVNSRLQKVYEKNGVGRSSPLVVNNMLFLQASGSVSALDPATGNVLWSAKTGDIHWQSPIVINGHLFVLTKDNKLTAFGTGISPTLSVPPMPTVRQNPTAPPITPTYYILQLGPLDTTKAP